ncbi:hypothetical protein GRI97_14105 [Altererythrobacter xixiisoli]|uniref:Uncharacterized protein n=1 Tax=Croceibacterium xixiisoli TaxID=1476466 RepID=A0A6I4TYI0_9SPHN|nr:hypothetical protein [Croceibacterium xixiisoli]MXP00122.1 hypothetical protein [Croceibacterium xixiisoli]
MSGTQTNTLGVAPSPTYADYVGLSDAAGVVAIVQVAKQAVVEPERSPGLARGYVRLYIEAQTEALISGQDGLGGSLVFVADVPLAPNGKPPKLKKQRMIIFADPVPGSAGTLQLVRPSAILPATPETEAQTRAVATALVAPDAPPKLTGIRDAISVAGNLAGEAETQMFVDTNSGAPVSLTVIRRPNMTPEWGVSWSEIVDQSVKAPAPQTLQWYRLACGLPRELPQDAYLQADRASRARASEDYAFILQQLGPCTRTIE